jgi:RNA polymerase sigma factor (sigma-70 family)
VIDTMVTAWERIGSLRDPAALRPWLLRIATRKAVGRRRSQPAHEFFGDIDPAAGAFDSEHLALGEALGGLPPRIRACLSLHYYTGLSVAETAAALGISPNTVKFHLKAGLERLRTALMEPTAAHRSTPQ